MAGNFPELSRKQLEELCLQQAERLADLRAVLNLALFSGDTDGPASAMAVLNARGRPLLAKAES